MTGPRELIQRSVRGAIKDQITGESAKTAYYLFLSLFPIVLVVFALTGMLGGHAAFEVLAARLEQAAPPQAAHYLEQFIRDVTDSRRPDLLSIGILLALWTGSNIFVALTEGLNRMFNVREDRRWWKRRVMAVGLLLAAMVLLVGGALILLAGGRIGAALGLGTAWGVLRYPLVFVMLTALMSLAYRFLPNRARPAALPAILIGAAIGTALWLLATTAFHLYISHFANYSRTYGFVAAAIVLLLWLFITAFSILFGGEVAAVVAGTDTQPR